MCGGAASSFPRVEPVLRSMGPKVFHAGPAGAGQVAKACNNQLLAVHMIGTCEVLEMGAAAGLAPHTLSEILLASSGRNWSLEVYNPYPGVMPAAPASNGYQPGFMVDLMVKDLGLASEVAEQAQHPSCAAAPSQAVARRRPCATPRLRALHLGRRRRAFNSRLSLSQSDGSHGAPALSRAPGQWQWRQGLFQYPRGAPQHQDSRALSSEHSA